MRLFAVLVLQSWRGFRRSFVSLAFAVVGPLMLAVYYIFFFFDQGAETIWQIRVGLVVEESAPLPKALTEALGRTKALSFERMTRSEGLNGLRKGEVDALFEYIRHTATIHVTTSPSLADVVSELAYALRPTRNGSADGNKLDIVVEESDARRGEQLVQWIAPGLVVFSIVNLGFLTAGSNVTLARQDGSLLLYEVTPVGGGRYVAAEVLVMALVGLMQGALFFGLFLGFSEFQITGSPVLVAGVVLLSSFTFASIGMFVAGSLPRAQIGFAVTPFLNLIMFGFGNVLWSAASVEGLRPLVVVLPSTYAVDALRHAVGGTDVLFPFWLDMLVLIATIGASLAGSMKWFKFSPGGG